MKKCIIYDLDGVVVLSEEFHQRAFEEVFKKHGIEYSMAKHVKSYTGTGNENIFRKEFEKAGVQEDLAKAIQEKQTIYCRLITHERLRLGNGFWGFNQSLDQYGVRRVLATSSNKNDTDLALMSAGIPNVFDVMVTFDDVRNPKPNPEVFLIAAKKVNLPPAECVVIEDSISGVKAAKAAGMRCVGMTTTVPAELLQAAGADIVVADFNGLDVKTLLA